MLELTHKLKRERARHNTGKEIQGLEESAHRRARSPLRRLSGVHPPTRQPRVGAQTVSGTPPQGGPTLLPKTPCDGEQDTRRSDAKRSETLNVSNGCSVYYNFTF